MLLREQNNWLQAAKESEAQSSDAERKCNADKPRKQITQSKITLRLQRFIPGQSQNLTLGKLEFILLTVVELATLPLCVRGLQCAW